MKIYPAEFDEAKYMVWIRDQLICQDCGKNLRNEKRNPCTHHVDGDIKNNRLNNLVMLCDSCHRKIHAHGLKKFKVKKFKYKEPEQYFAPKGNLMFHGI